MPLTTRPLLILCAGSPYKSCRDLGRGLMLQRRLLCTKSQQWSIKQVTKSNFSETLDHFKAHISASDFVAVSLQNTGSFSAPWHRVTPFDSAETAYSKAAYAAHKFQILQFAVCPFSIKASNLIAHPYNFHLFPRDELGIGMPSYSFSCQASYLTSMAREGFDFNVCIYDGISYLSRAQEPKAIERLGNPTTSAQAIIPTLTTTVADSLFVERIKSRVKHWRNGCKVSIGGNNEALLISLKKLVAGSEEFGSRPSMIIDVCSERQVQLALEMLKEFSDDLVPLIVPTKSGATQAVRVVLTSSSEDKNLLQKELHELEEEQSKRLRGFREVIELISASQKPVVAHNSLNDLTFIHSKFLAPLPPTIEEFRCSLRAVFPFVLDVNHLMMEISPLKKVANLHAAMSSLKRRFFAPINMEIPHQANDGSGEKTHGHKVLTVTQMFAKQCSILKITPDYPKTDSSSNLALTLQDYANIFIPHSTISQESLNRDDTVRNGNLVFLWGFHDGVSVNILKNLLRDSHVVFSKEFDVRLVSKGCAILVFTEPGFSKMLLEDMNSGESCCESLRDLVSEGVRAGGYEIYERVCRLGLWEVDLAEALDRALEAPERLSKDDSEKNPYFNRESVIDFDEL